VQIADLASDAEGVVCSNFPGGDVVCVGAVARQAGPGAKRALVRREAEVAV
jgi:hypothetical protein